MLGTGKAEKQAKRIFTTLKINPPNMIIEAISGSFHPLYMLADDELKAPGIKNLWNHLRPR